MELGNSEGLQRCYGNRAEILRSLGRLEEAIDLLKTQERICLELNDKKSLAYCYFCWGLAARGLGDSKHELSKLQAAHSLFAELPMPLEVDNVAAEITKTQTAEIS